MKPSSEETADTSVRMTVARLRAGLDQCLLRDHFALEPQLDALAEQRDPTAFRREGAKLERRLRRSMDQVRARRAALPAPIFPEDLPITAAREELVRAICEHPVIIVAGETGSGKTTQIPKLCLEAGLGSRGRIGCTQPRRIAALSVSRRVAEELGVAWGRTVGAAVRFRDKTSRDTVIKFMTDGILLNELQLDPLLTAYEAIIVDEAHERSLNIDFIIGFLRRLRHQRPDLKIIITSATIDTERFSAAFDGAPVFEVSGRLYPVDIHYRPLDPEDSEDNRYDTILEAVAGVTADIIGSYPPGDILVFLSGERSIREAADMLQGRNFPHTEVLPLFGRLASPDQERIFHPGNLRRIILATNIAETSVTIPRIRYVIDSGYARISRYSAHTKTLRLPIEPISQSSARQRAGRCGRVEAGVCFRLYSAEDLASRPEFTPPEIQRANLASVILQLLDMGIPDIEAFPFLEPPEERAVRGGLNLLRELKAVDAERRLTATGRKLARLTVDPTIGAMLLHAPRETCLREILVIAAGMSIQDPRERPADREEAADVAHRRFHHPSSDFLTLLQIWMAYREAAHQQTRNQLKKWCRDHFLSHLRMREWQDIQEQLSSLLNEMGLLRLHDDEAEPSAIHRAILAGLPSNVACRDEGNHYRATHSRKVMLFPGSVLFDKRAMRKTTKARAKTAPRKQTGTATPEWILCGEWLETTRLFARTAAAIEPRWIVEFAGHLIRESVSEPNWDRVHGRVIAKKRLILYGLEIDVRTVSYAAINPAAAREWFIRSALIEQDLENPPLWMEHNQEVRRRLEDWQVRTRRPGGALLDDRIYAVLAREIGDAPVGSLGDLNRWLKQDPERREKLRLSEEELLKELAPSADPVAFPVETGVGEATYPIDYQFCPGEETDGATLRLPIGHFESLREGMLDWIVPGYIADKIECMLRALPKSYRVQLHPLAEKTEVLLRSIQPGPEPLAAQLRKKIQERFQVDIPMTVWRSLELPPHLQVRVELLDEKDRPVAGARQWDLLETAYAEAMAKRHREGAGLDRSAIWKRAARRYEREGLHDWTIGDLPESIHLGDLAGIPVTAWPGLACATDGTVALRLFRSRAGAVASTRPALRRLAENRCARDLGWLRKDLKALQPLGPLVSPLTDAESFFEQARDMLLRHCFDFPRVLPLEKEYFEERCRLAAQAMRGLPLALRDRLQPILELRNALAVRPKAYPGLKADLARLMPPDFLKRLRYEQLPYLHRYLRGLQVRAERWALNPEKDRSKAETFRPVLQRLDQLLKTPPAAAESRVKLNRLFWLVEEYRVSVFAQELGTAEKVSPKSIQALLVELEQG